MSPYHDCRKKEKLEQKLLHELQTVVTESFPKEKYKLIKTPKIQSKKNLRLG